MEFNCVVPLNTVHSFLTERGGLRLLDDPLMSTATAEIISADRPRHEVQRDIKVGGRLEALNAFPFAR